MSNTFKALAIVAGVGLMTLGFVAAFMHWYLDRMGPKFIFPLLMAIISTIFVGLRMWGVEPETWATQMVATWLSFLPIIMAVMVLLINKMNGKHESTVEDENKKL